MVVVTLAELAVSSVESLRAKLTELPVWHAIDLIVFVTMLGLGLNFLGHHDTEYGHLPLLAAIGVGMARCLPRIPATSRLPARSELDLDTTSSSSDSHARLAHAGCRAPGVGNPA